jgi:hypothetical protein
MTGLDVGSFRCRISWGFIRGDVPGVRELELLKVGWLMLDGGGRFLRLTLGPLTLSMGFV